MRKSASALKRGTELFNASRYSEARAEFEAALALDPDSSRAAVALAHSLQFSGEPERALEIVSSLAKAKPGDAEARAGLAEIHGLQGRVSDAIAAYEAVAALAPKDASVHVSLGRLHLRAGDPAAAEAALRKAVALKAGPEASLLLAEILKEKGAAGEAAPLLRRAASGKAPAGDPRARLAAGLTRFQAHVKLGAFKKAFAEADALLAEQPSQECIDSFFVSPERGELLKVMTALKEFAAAAPGNPWPRYFLATLLSNMGRGEEAILETERLASAPRERAWMRHKHGELLLTNRRDYAGARREYEAALACVPAFWKARAALAEIDLCQGDPAAALARAGELVDALPERSRPWGLVVRGRLRLWTGDYAGAVLDLDPAVKAGAPAAARLRAAARLFSGDRAGAAEDLAAALGGGADVEALVLRGELRRLSGDAAGAIEDLGAAIRMDGSNSFWALANRALARGDAGDAAGQWTDYATIRRDVLDRFEKEGGAAPASAAESAAVRRVLEAGLRLGRGLRASNEHLFPVWMGHVRRP